MKEYKKPMIEVEEFVLSDVISSGPSVVGDLSGEWTDEIDMDPGIDP